MSDAAAEPTDLSGAYEVAFDEAVRAVSQQHDALGELRGRTGTLIAATAIATSLLGGLTVQSDSVSPLTWVALGAFMAVGVMAVVILWPYEGWRFSTDAHDLIDTYVEADSPATLAEIHRDLAIHIQDDFIGNGHQLDRLYRLFRLASIFLVIELVIWLADLALR